MKKLVLFMIILCLTTPTATAGGLNPVGGRGPRHGGMSGAYSDDASLFCYNPAGISRLKDLYFDASAEIILPKFTIKNRLGKWHSDGSAYYLMPMLGFIRPINEDISVGLGITTPYGLGAKFDSDFFGGIVQSETLVSLTNITPALSLRIKDSLFLGIGINAGYAQFKYKAPFDVAGVFLPIPTNSKGDGWGLGVTIGLEWRPTEKLLLGLSYMTEQKVNISGNTEISGLLGLLSVRDGFDSAFTFPPRLSGSAAWQATDDLLLAFTANWYGYSKSTDDVTLSLHDLPIRKTNLLDWRDNYSLHAGARYRLNDRWCLNGGVGYQNAAVPADTMSQLTPDATGWDIAASVVYYRNDFSLTAHTIYGWGQAEARNAEFLAETWTFGLSGNWLF